MNVSIISTYGKAKRKSKFNARKLTRVLLDLAELHLQKPETRHYISIEGLEKVRKKLA